MGGQNRHASLPTHFHASPVTWLEYRPSAKRSCQHEKIHLGKDGEGRKQAACDPSGPDASPRAIRCRSAIPRLYSSRSRQTAKKDEMLACASIAVNRPLAAGMSSRAATSDLDVEKPAAAARKNALCVVRELGAGRQGRVLQAFDESERRDVAVKLPAAFAGDGQRARLDLRELEYQVRAIQHESNALLRVSGQPNVVQWVQLLPGMKLGCEYAALVTELAPNGDLFDLVAFSGALSEPLAKLYCHQLLRALEACHTHDVVHRDVKPENLLLDANFTLKLCDFGVAAMGPTDALLRDDSGTALYMAPEIRAKRLYRGPPVDLWSTGVVLFILLTGLPPFNFAEPGDASYDALLAGDLPRFWASQPPVATACVTPLARELVSALLCANPEQRLTLEQALQHPWLADAENVDPALVFKDMTARRQQTVASQSSS